MCGIAGFIGNFETDLLTKMGAAQGHRGPDGLGTWSEGKVGLSHVRLSIIDISAGGSQPMWDCSRRVVVSFNGEIYNYRELRERCEREGVIFSSQSDTEVLVNLLAKFGTDCLPWLNGIFAFAAWFSLERKLIIARDAVGVKPLYWTKTEAGYGFASEIKALICIPGIDYTPDPLAIASYLTLLYAPGVLTPVQGIRKVLPGTYLEFEAEQSVKVRTFAPKHYAQEVQDLSKKNAIEACRHYLNQAVRRQLVADVPLGGFLSGGVDSSTIAHYAVKNVKSSRDFPCFTMAQASLGKISDEGFEDDFPFALKVSKDFGLTLNAVNLDAGKLLELDWIVWQLDEPTPDLAPIVSYSICKAAQSQGIKVLLSGAGGDDIFSGYRRHLALDKESYWGWLPSNVRAGLKRISSQVAAKTPLGRRMSKLFRYADTSSTERLASYFLWIHEEALLPALSVEFKAALGLHRPVETLSDSIATLPEGVSRLNQMLHLDRSFFLADHNLNYTDKTAMACGVEVRVPFLDIDLVSFTERLPDSFKINGNHSKYLLREAMTGVLPDYVLNRPKTGFGFPLRELIHGVYGQRLEALAQSGRLNATGIFDGKEVVNLLNAERRGEIDAAYPLLGVLFIESWFRQFTGK